MFVVPPEAALGELLVKLPETLIVLELRVVLPLEGEPKVKFTTCKLFGTVKVTAPVVATVIFVVTESVFPPDVITGVPVTKIKLSTFRFDESVTVKLPVFVNVSKFICVAPLSVSNVQFAVIKKVFPVVVTVPDVYVKVPVPYPIVVPNVIVPVVFIVKLLLIPPDVTEFVESVPVPFITIKVVPVINPLVVELEIKLPPTVKVLPLKVESPVVDTEVKFPVQVKLFDKV